jgi:hypothetical protein
MVIDVIAVSVGSNPAIRERMGTNDVDSRAQAPPTVHCVVASPRKGRGGHRETKSRVFGNAESQQNRIMFPFTATD